MTAILALDPGTEQTGWCEFVAGRVVGSGVAPNRELLARLAHWPDPHYGLAIEMVASYGMPVGREVFETCVWIGRFQQAWSGPVRLVYRRDAMAYLRATARRKKGQPKPPSADSRVRSALIAKLGKKETAGVKSHAWAALAVAVTAGSDGWPLPQNPLAALTA